MARLPRLRSLAQGGALSPREKFDRFMVAVELASNPKIGRLTDAEFRCLLSGVWALAAKARPRGALRVAGLPADANDIAHQSRQTVAVARRTLDKLRSLGMVEHDPELGCEVVHDWDDINPSPKPSESKEAQRERKRKQRDKSKSHANVTPMSRVTSLESHATEVEVEEEGVTSHHSSRPSSQKEQQATTPVELSNREAS